MALRVTSEMRLRGPYSRPLGTEDGPDRWRGASVSTVSDVIRAAPVNRCSFIDFTEAAVVRTRVWRSYRGESSAK